jgi:NADPH:quinone reductase-like Zn-dependent oxidoreductase
MKAAVLTDYDHAPTYRDFPEPVPNGPGQLLVEVLAAGLHHLTIGRASGKHYSSSGTLPLVPGVDGVGRGSDGKARYFVLDETATGSLADKTVIDLDRSITLPDGADPVAVAACMNPAMGPWLALRCRVPLQKGQNILILGATGNAGRMAVQVARHLGAAQIIGAGRDERKLAALGALGTTNAVTLTDPALPSLAREVDVVLDFLWGESSAQLMVPMIKARADRNRALTWIEVGSIAGENAAIPAAALRAANFQIVGSGLGSVPGRDIVKELPALVHEIARGTLQIDAQARKLSDIERAWTDARTSDDRIVLTP